MARSPSGSVEAINSSLSAVCLFEFFANLYYSLMACWPRTGSGERRLSSYLFYPGIIHHEFFFLYLKKKGKENQHLLAGLPSCSTRFWALFFFFYCIWCLFVNCSICFLPDNLLKSAAWGEDYQREPWKQWGGAQASLPMWLWGTNVFSLLRLLAEPHTHCSLSPPWQYSVRRSIDLKWGRRGTKMLCLIATRGQGFDAGTVKFVIC